MMRPGAALLQILIYPHPGPTGGIFCSRLLIWCIIKVEGEWFDLCCWWVPELSLMCLVLMEGGFGEIWHTIKRSQTVE